MLLAAGCFLLGGCYEVKTTHPTVYVDSSFSDAETLSVEAGLASWETVPSVSFTRVYVSHEEILAMARSNSLEDTIYLILNVGRHDHANCPTEKGEIGDEAAAWTAVAAHMPSSSTICFDITYLDNAELVDPGEWAGAVEHEIGHSFGMAHDDSGPATVMYPRADLIAHELTCEDEKKFDAIWHNGMSERCK